MSSEIKHNIVRVAFALTLLSAPNVARAETLNDQNGETGISIEPPSFVARLRNDGQAVVLFVKRNWRPVIREVGETTGEIVGEFVEGFREGKSDAPSIN